MNNPLLYVDYDGNEPITIISAIITGLFITTNVIMPIYNGTFTWGGLAKSVLITAAVAAVTFGVGSVASSIFTSAANGFLQGAIQGAVIGAITGVGGTVANAAFTGENLTLKTLIKGALIGAVTGAVVGGIQGGMRAQENGLNHSGQRMGEQTDYADADKSSGSATNDAQGDVLNWFNEGDGGLYKVAQNDPGVPAGTVRIYAHGNKNGLQGADRFWINTPKKFDRVLTERSPAWRNYKANGGSIKIELMSCNTGNGFASTLSKSFWGSTVIAPNNYFVAARSGAWSGVAGQGRWLTFNADINVPFTFNNLNYRK